VRMPRRFANLCWSEDLCSSWETTGLLTVSSMSLSTMHNFFIVHTYTYRLSIRKNGWVPVQQPCCMDASIIVFPIPGREPENALQDDTATRNLIGPEEQRPSIKIELPFDSWTGAVPPPVPVSRPQFNNPSSSQIWVLTIMGRRKALRSGKYLRSIGGTEPVPVSPGLPRKEKT
jgi:hypothetical protein